MNQSSSTQQQQQQLQQRSDSSATHILHRKHPDMDPGDELT